MIFPQDESIGRLSIEPRGPFVTGQRLTLRVMLTVGPTGMSAGQRLRIGLPNTGWQEPVVPQHRYWDELVSGSDRRYAPFHPVNTTVRLQSQGEPTAALHTMERMLVPDEDPAEAYWRWWITVTLESDDLSPGDRIEVTYGDPRFTGQPARIQTFAENQINLSAYLETADGTWVRPADAPVFLDVVAGPAVRANIVVPSIWRDHGPTARIAFTDACHCLPSEVPTEKLVVRDGQWRRIGELPTAIDTPVEVKLKPGDVVLGPLSLTNSGGNKVWGKANPYALSQNPRDSQLFWGDLHAQSEFHVMHSQRKDARQVGWSKGISSGTPDDVYQYARDVALLDFVAITDQGAITGVGWDLLQEKAEQYNGPGRFATFKAYEAGTPTGHRNVYFRGGDHEPAQSSESFNYLPEFLYEYYRGRDDVIMIPHHVKAWTDWSFHDPQLEPLMEIYSCWGQSENPSLDRWNKGMTPGAGAWEALARGYRLGMIASSDNHVGMAGRSYPHDRQVHTPFPGGLAAVWAPELTREAIFDALRARRCYGTTGARIILDVWVMDHPMGSIVQLKDPTLPREIRVDARGSDEIKKIEIVSNGHEVVHVQQPSNRGTQDHMQFEWSDDRPTQQETYYYVRVTQRDGEMAWSSPVWVT